MSRARTGVELLRMREISILFIASRYPNRDMRYVCNRDIQTGGQKICSKRPSWDVSLYVRRCVLIKVVRPQGSCPIEDGQEGEDKGSRRRGNILTLLRLTKAVVCICLYTHKKKRKAKKAGKEKAISRCKRCLLYSIKMGIVSQSALVCADANKKRQT